MSNELQVLSVEDIEAYISGEYLKDSYEVTADKALTYCRLLIGLYRQTDTLTKELKANAAAARERTSNTTSELVAMTQRAEAAEAQLAIVSGLNEWHDLPELPSHVGHYLAFWKEDGVWVAQYWPSGIEDENGNKGNWLTTPDGSIRPNPITWRHLPSVPDRYVVQAEYSRA